MKKMMPGGNATPRITITSEQFPGVKDWKKGETYKVEVELKAVAKMEGMEYSFDTANKDLVRMTFEIVSITEDTPEEDASEE